MREPPDQGARLPVSAAGNEEGPRCRARSPGSAVDTGVLTRYREPIRQVRVDGTLLNPMEKIAVAIAAFALAVIPMRCTLVDVCESSECKDTEFHAALIFRLSGTPSAQTSTTTSSSCNPCYIFVTSANQRPGIDFVSPTTADARCMADITRPATGNYKALLVSAATRLACTTNNCTGGAAENLDWVLKPATSYRRLSDGAALMTTNASGIFIFGTLTTPFSAGIPGWWTGMNAATWRLASACTSNNWTTTGGSANFGDPNLQTSGSLSNGTDPCTTTGSKLLCVEQ